MAVYSLAMFDIAAITTTASGFNDNGGFQFELGVDTVTLLSGWPVQTVLVEDTTDAYFDDDAGAAQTLSGDQVINGQAYPGGTFIESEYTITVEDAQGTQYTLQFVSLDEYAFDIHGFVVQGTAPPLNEALTVVAAADMTSGVHAYTASVPVCFTAGTGIATTCGTVPVEALRPGDRLRLAGGGNAPLRLALPQVVSPLANPRARPVRIRAGALGPGHPARGLSLSPQHRVHLAGPDVLVPARALTVLPGVGVPHVCRPVRYIHLVLDRHALILAEGLACESFWPGEEAMRLLSPATRRRIRWVMGTHPVPARPLLSVGAGRRLLAGVAPAR